MCVFNTRRKTEASLMNRVLSVLAGPMRSKVLVLFSTLSEIVTRAWRREAWGMPLDWMRFSRRRRLFSPDKGFFTLSQAGSTPKAHLLVGYIQPGLADDRRS